MHAITTSSPGLPLSSHLVCLCSHGKWMGSPSSTPGRVLQCLQIEPPPTQEYLCFSWPFWATSSIFPKLKRLVGQGKEQGGTNMLELVGIPRYHRLIPPPFGQNLQRGFYTTCAQFFSFFPQNPLQLDSGPHDNQYSLFCCQWNSSQSSCYSSYLIAALMVNPFLFSQTPSSLGF